jgi:multidrug efflux pump
MGFPISSYQANVPQLDAEVDRVKAKAQGVPLTELFDTLQTYLGSAYVNDFNMFGRTWQVIAQADGPFRDNVEDIANLRTRNDRGEMVPIGSMVTVKPDLRPRPGAALQRLSRRRPAGRGRPARAVLRRGDGQGHRLAPAGAAPGMAIEWTDLSYQQATQGKAAWWCSRWPCCWPSWCWPRCTKAGPCRWR